LIVLETEGAGQVPGLGREVLAADEVWRKTMAIDSQIVEQAAEADQKIGAGFVG
jgi:hypothetical protein